MLKRAEFGRYVYGTAILWSFKSSFMVMLILALIRICFSSEYVSIFLKSIYLLLSMRKFEERKVLCVLKIQVQINHVYFEKKNLRIML
jgi:hypothetical protein